MATGRLNLREMLCVTSEVVALRNRTKKALSLSFYNHDNYSLCYSIHIKQFSTVRILFTIFLWYFRVILICQFFKDRKQKNVKNKRGNFVFPINFYKISTTFPKTCDLGIHPFAWPWLFPIKYICFSPSTLVAQIK